MFKRDNQSTTSRIMYSHCSDDNSSIERLLDLHALSSVSDRRDSVRNGEGHAVLSSITPLAKDGLHSRLIPCNVRFPLNTSPFSFSFPPPLIHIWTFNSLPLFCNSCSQMSSGSPHDLIVFFFHSPSYYLLTDILYSGEFSLFPPGSSTD